MCDVLVIRLSTKIVADWSILVLLIYRVATKSAMFLFKIAQVYFLYKNRLAIFRYFNPLICEITSNV